MASAYSTLHNYASLPVYTPDLTLVLEGLKYKQGKYDENREKLQSALDKYSMLDVVKNEDENYLVDRLQKVEEITNRYTHMDLSSDVLTQSLIRNMGQVLDDNVKNAVLSSKIYRNEQSSWKKLQEDDPDKYARQNYEFAQQGAQSWLADGQAGSKYNGGGGIIEFVDVNQTIKDGMKDLKDVYGLELVELESGAKGTLFRDVVTREIATPTKVRQALESLLGPKEMQQLQIDAWAQFKGAPEDAVVNMATERQNFKIDSYATQVSKLESVLTNNTLTPEQKADYQNQLESAKLNLQNAKEKPLGGLDVSNKETAYTSLYINDYLDGLTDLYSYNVVTDIKVYDNDKETYNAKIKLEELAIKKEKETTKKAKAGTTDEVTAFTSQNVLLGTEAGGEPKDAIQQVEDIVNQSILDVESVVGDLNEDNYDAFNQTFSDDVLSKKFGENVDFNGKSITLTKENIAKITSAKSALSGRQFNIYNETNDFYIQKITDNLAQLTSAFYTEDADVDMDPTELIFPNFFVRSIYDGETNKNVLKRFDRADGSTYYLPLLKKYGDNLLTKGKEEAWKSLTLVEQTNLKMLSASMTIYDQDTDDLVAKTVDHTLKTDILRDASAEITQSISNDLKSARANIIGGVGGGGLTEINLTRGTYMKFKYLGLDVPLLSLPSERLGYNKIALPDLQGKIDELAVIEKEFSGAPVGSQRKGQLDANMRNKIEEINQYVKSKSATAIVNREESLLEDNYLSELDASDTEYQLSGADEVSLESMSGFIGGWKEQLTEKAKASMGDLSDLISVTGLKLTKDDPSYNMLVNQAKDPDGNPFVPSGYSDIIQISPVISEGAATGQYKLQAILTDKQKEDGYTGEAILNEAQVESAKLSLPVNLEITNYNTSLKDGAAKINLGTGQDNSYSIAISDTNEDIFAANISRIIEKVQDKPGSEGFVSIAIDDYQNGKYKFGIEAMNVNNTGYHFYGVMYVPESTVVNGVTYKKDQAIPIKILRNSSNSPEKILNSSQVVDFISNSKTYASSLFTDFLEQQLDSYNVMKNPFTN
jgi:hypothetical protein